MCLWERNNKKEGLDKNQGHIDLEKLEAGGALLQNFALFIHQKKVDNPLEEALEMADLYYQELETHVHRIGPVFCYQDIEKNEKEGRISALLTIEEGGVCKGSLAQLRNLYRLGVRMMTLTWNYPNEIGFPAWNPEEFSQQDKSCDSKAGISQSFPYHKAKIEDGLTEKGRELVAEMERIGMIVDVSHLSDQGFYDVLETTVKPFVASHSNARAICPCARNLTDDMIKKLAERGGVLGLNFCPDFLTLPQKGQPNPGTLEALNRHISHILNVGGEECLGLGGDFDGIPTHAELPDYSYMDRLVRLLEEQGLRQETLEKIFYKNVLRVYKEIL